MNITEITTKNAGIEKEIEDKFKTAKKIVKKKWKAELANAGEVLGLYFGTSGEQVVYAQTLILVNLIVVNIIGFFVITRNPVGISGPY